MSLILVALSLYALLLFGVAGQVNDVLHTPKQLTVGRERFENHSCVTLYPVEPGPSQLLPSSEHIETGLISIWCMSVRGEAALTIV